MADESRPTLGNCPGEMELQEKTEAIRRLNSDRTGAAPDGGGSVAIGAAIEAVRRPPKPPPGRGREKHRRPELLSVGGKLRRAAIFAGDVLNGGEADAEAALRLAER